MVMKKIFRSLIALTFLATMLAGCAHKIPWGQVKVSVVNQSERPIKNIHIEYGSDFFDVAYLDANGSQSYSFFLLPAEPIKIQYTDPNNAKIEKSYQMRLDPEHRGVMEFRFNREGRVKPVCRYDVF